jgi:phosphatidylethanolamine-binding protein (PEBP) family uncharacterized protein
VKLRNISALSLSMFVVVVVAGCGGGGTSASEKPAILFGTPVLTATDQIPGNYRCDTRAVWVPLRWRGLPAGTQELVLYMVRFGNPTAHTGGQVKAEIKAEAMVVGLKPTLEGLSPGKFPAGSTLGIHAPTNQQVSICPPKGVTQNLLFRIYALPHKLNVNKGSQNANLVTKLNGEALEVGTFIAHYRPRQAGAAV